MAKARGPRTRATPTTRWRVLVSMSAPIPVQLEYRTGTTPAQRAQGPGRADLCGGRGLHAAWMGGTLDRARPDNGAQPARAPPSRAASPRRVAKGDYVLVPPGTPHWYTDVEGEFVSVALHMPMEQDVVLCSVLASLSDATSFRRREDRPGVRAEHKPGNNVVVLVSVGPYPAQLEYRIPGSTAQRQRAQGPGRVHLYHRRRLHAYHGWNADGP